MKAWPAMRDAVLRAALVLATAAAVAAPPQTVYRCGPDGRVYSQTPCADGRPVTIDDPRSASQRQAAREAAERDAQLAKQLAEERRQREAAAAGQGLAGIQAAPATAAKASASARKTKTMPAAGDPVMSPPMRVPAASAAQ